MTSREIDNPYLEEIRADPDVARQLGNFLRLDMGSPEMAAAYRTKKRLRAKYSWAIPNGAALNAIERHVREAGLRGIVEIGAGTGYWAHMLTGAGLDVVAFDDFSWDMHSKHPRHYDVRGGGPDEAAAHADRALLLCWPPTGYGGKKPAQQQPGQRRPGGREAMWEEMHGAGAGQYRGPQERGMGGAALKAYTGPLLVYIGEPHGGFSGDEHFWKQIGGDWTEIETIAIPQWHGIHDGVAIYRRGGVSGSG